MSLTLDKSWNLQTVTSGNRKGPGRLAPALWARSLGAGSAGLLSGLLAIQRKPWIGLVAVVAACFATSAHAQARRTPVGINLTGLSYWSTEQPFTNLASNASRWRAQPIGQPFTWDAPLPPLTETQYPSVVPNGMVLESFLLGTPHRGHLSKKLVVLYDGEGSLNYAMGGRLETRAPGRDVILDTGQGPIVGRLTSTNPQNPLRNIRVYEPEAAAKPTTFRKAFLDRWLGMSVLRFMDWMQTNNSKVSQWEQRPRKGQFTLATDTVEGGAPLDSMIELSNTLKAAPWFSIPHLADDDYVRRFAEQVKDELDPTLPVYVEYSNEVWNSIFEQSRYAARRGKELKLSGNDYEAQLRYYSQRTTEVLRIWEDVFGDMSPRVLGVYAAQAPNPWTSETVLRWGEARRHADVLAVAPYFGNSLGDPAQQEEVSVWSVDKIIQVLGREVANESKEMIKAQAEVAQAMNVRLVAYEGGQHLAGYGGAENNAKLQELFYAANRDPRMKDLYLTHLKTWSDAGGDLYVAFSSMGEYTKWGSWGLLEKEGQNPATAPKWEALRQFMRDAAADYAGK
jgi:hypothetical protein